jgi:hypothetical protein
MNPSHEEEEGLSQRRQRVNNLDFATLFTSIERSKLSGFAIKTHGKNSGISAALGQI